MSKKRQKTNEAQIKGGSMAWLMTFADLMSLLMAFFVILFALSEVDKEKFKMLGYSLKQAFGMPVPPKLNNNEKTKIIDPATSKAKKSADQDARKKEDKQVKYSIPLTPTKKAHPAQQAPAPTKAKNKDKDKDKDKDKNKDQSKQLNKELVQQQKKDIAHLKAIFKQQIDNKHVEILRKNDKIIIRLYGKGAFHSGAEQLTPEMTDSLDKFAEAMKYIKGTMVIAGHTDDRPIKNHRFRSNWELSAARAHSIIHVLTTQYGVDPKRLSLRGYAHTRNLHPNDNDDNRARNRRVEISIDQRSVKSAKSALKHNNQPNDP